MDIYVYVIFAICILLTAIIYGQLLFSNSVANIDAFLVTDLKNISSLKDYIEAWKSYKIADIQPIRDITYFVDLKLSSLFGFDTFPFPHASIKDNMAAIGNARQQVNEV